MSLLVNKAGILDTIQDRGRFGYRRLGVNPNGPMDPIAVRLLNTLIGNHESSAVIEVHFPAGDFVFQRSTAFAVGGADFGPELSGLTISNWKIYNAAEGDVLKFRRKRSGNRAYIAVSGGFAGDDWLGSFSTNLVAKVGGFNGRRLQTGDRIEFASSKAAPPNTTGSTLFGPIVPTYSSSPPIRFTRGPEFDRLTALSQQAITAEPFRVTKNSDRMGFRLEGPPLHKLDADEMLSSGTTLGTMQLLPDGQIIVLMADHQTTGGYPRIGVIASVDIPSIAQLGPGDELTFDIIETNEAERMALRFERELGFLRTGIRVRSGAL